MQKLKGQGEGRLVLELESDDGELKDMTPADGEDPAVGAVNQSLQLRCQKEGEGHARLTGLLHTQREHAAEVVAAHSQHDPVD